MRGTRIPTHHYGCSLPHESPAVGNGYAASGEVKTYTLPPEEIARIFGQAKPAEGKPPLKLRNPYQREADKVSKENRLELLRKVLTKEEYLSQKEKGIADADICARAVGYVWADCVNALKKEWGLIGKLPNPGNAKKKEEIKQAVKVDIEKPKAEQPVIELFDANKSCEEHLADMIAIKNMGTVTPGQRALTALEAADEFYTLQEDLDVLDEEISRLTKERVHTTDRMKVLKEALEGVTVAI